ncbi:hypothetical protein [Streptomyces sp. NPDC004528]|uniref:hypothetical protein n=1 Tax=Streptomyces sp. NPDC004528 TaxID=3154550 RepID=UPI0033BDE11B
MEAFFPFLLRVAEHGFDVEWVCGVGLLVGAVPRDRTDLFTHRADLSGRRQGTRYAARWWIEATFGAARGILGVGQARHRTRRAVQRGVPFGLYFYTITVVWYALHGHHPQNAAKHQARAPWYLTMTHPAFSDMTARLRRTIVAARFVPIDAVIDDPAPPVASAEPAAARVDATDADTVNRAGSIAMPSPVMSPGMTLPHVAGCDATRPRLVTAFLPAPRIHAAPEATVRTSHGRLVQGAAGGHSEGVSLTLAMR